MVRRPSDQAPSVTCNGKTVMFDGGQLVTESLVLAKTCAVSRSIVESVRKVSLAENEVTARAS